MLALIKIHIGRPTWVHVDGYHEARLGFKNLILGGARVAKTPLNMEANLASKNYFFEAPVGIHFEGVSWRPLSATEHFVGGPRLFPKLL